MILGEVSWCLQTNLFSKEPDYDGYTREDFKGKKREWRWRTCAGLKMSHWRVVRPLQGHSTAQKLMKLEAKKGGLTSLERGNSQRLVGGGVQHRGR